MNVSAFRRKKSLDKYDFFSSDAYLELRYECLERNEFMCEACGTVAGDDLDNPIQVDHIKPRSKFPELSLDPGNLQALCKKCNFGKRAREHQAVWAIKEKAKKRKLLKERIRERIIKMRVERFAKERGLKVRTFGYTLRKEPEGF